MIKKNKIKYDKIMDKYDKLLVTKLAKRNYNQDCRSQPNENSLTTEDQSIDLEVEDQSIDLEAEKQSKEFVEKLKQKFIDAPNEQKISFLLTGRTGVGKSSTINFLMGKKIAPVGDFEPTTIEVKNYQSNINGVEIIINDTPGLCDDLEEVGNDYKYLELMRTEVTKVDSMWFVSRLDEARVGLEEKKGIKLISECFTPKIWEQAIIIFTFADNVSPKKYPYTLQKRTELIRKEISKYAGVQIANNIPSVAVDNKNKLTPDGKKWLGELFTQVYLRLSEEDVLPFLMSTLNRIQLPEKKQKVVYKTVYRDRPSPSTASTQKENNIQLPEPNSLTETSLKPDHTDPIELTPDNTRKIQKKTEKVIEYTVKGATTGATTGASIGAAIGSLTGPAGTMVGGVVGGAAGGVVGAAIGFVAGLFG
ncbi:MAG: GTPase [Crocosphaera sp.]